jgi:hypothetical protein
MIVADDALMLGRDEAPDVGASGAPGGPKTGWR